MPTVAETKYKGNSAYRLVPDQENPREIAFADEWIDENSAPLPPWREPTTLGYLLSDDPGMWQCPSSRDEMVAATVIQWLGSNVGFSFLRNALARCGYEIVNTDRRKRG